jgi:hypothetical protein
MRQQMEGLLYQHGVDIVFSGHVISLSPHYSFTFSNGFITLKKEPAQFSCPNAPTSKNCDYRKERNRGVSIFHQKLTLTDITPTNPWEITICPKTDDANFPLTFK